MAAGDWLERKKQMKPNLLKFLKGSALFNLYSFMKDEWSPATYTGMEKSVKKQLIKEQIKGGPRIGVPECVTYAAVEDLDPLCCETIDFLMEIMASHLQRVVLTFAPLPGAEVYLSGGVANYLAPYFKKR